VHRVPDTHISYILPSVLRSREVILGVPYSEEPLPSPLVHVLDDLGRKRITGRRFYWFLGADGLDSEDRHLREVAIAEEIHRIIEKYQMRWEELRENWIT
jgi:hypothetical protein